MKWKRPVRQRQVSSGEKQPDLSRKIYSACHRFFIYYISQKETVFVAKTDPEAARRQRHKTIRWVVTVFLITVVISGIISLVSDEVMDSSSLPVAFLILLAIVMVGIVFDIIGMAVATADEKPFHSMAARKVPGSQEAIRLLRNAERVSSICNDVVGDICGVVSGDHCGADPHSGGGRLAAGRFSGHVRSRGGADRGRQGHRQDLRRQFLHADRSHGGQGAPCPEWPAW